MQSLKFRDALSLPGSEELALTDEAVQARTDFDLDLAQDGLHCLMVQKIVKAAEVSLLSKDHSLNPAGA